jgi:GT2 family glycosyltransferase
MKAVRAMNQAIPHSLPIQNTCLVTVTYGERFDFLQSVIEAACKNGILKTFIVSNNAEPNSLERIRTLEAESEGSINVIYLPENIGSAGGYKVGLENAANCPDCDFIWLLDDDNQPRENALDELLKHYKELSKTLSPHQLSLLSLREDREQLKRAARMTNAYRIFPRTSSFLGFHVLDIPRKFMKALHLNSPEKILESPNSAVEIPFGPYGGLFFHKTLLREIGYPDERFFVYADDTEFTFRLTQRGKKLFLIPSSTILDVDNSWHKKVKGSHFEQLLLGDSDFRIYFSVRNQAYVDRYVWMKNYAVYTLNKLIFLGILSSFAYLVHKKTVRFELIYKAIQDGERQQLGLKQDW